MEQIQIIYFFNIKKAVLPLYKIFYDYDTYVV
jgi:hypothetical protein